MNYRVFYLFTALTVLTSTLLVGNIFASDISTDQPDLTNQVSLDEPAVMKSGHNQPRRVFVNETLLDVPLNYSWNYIPTKPTQSLSNWLTYGGIGEETEQFMVGVQFKGQIPFRSQGLRNAISSLKIFKDAKIKPLFVGRTQQTETKFGTLNTINFGYKKNGLTKVCLGYLSEPNSIKLRGFYCTEDPTTKWRHKLPCLINSLKIYDEAYWREPKGAKTDNTVCSLDKTTESKI
jgi:hypothetical protein